MTAKPDFAQRPAFWLALTGWGVLFSAYVGTFMAFEASAFGEAVQRALFNTLPALFLTWPVVQLIRHRVIERPVVTQISTHVALAIGFGLLWFLGIQVGYGLLSRPTPGAVMPGPVLTWQLFQGVTLYTIVGLYAHMTHYRNGVIALETRLADMDQAGPPEAKEGVSHIFVKDGRVLRPIPVADIWLLSGVGETTEVLTADGTFLSKQSLSDLEAELPSETFLRIHRSHIVATDAVHFVEPGGDGCLTLHLQHGTSVTTSRDGAARLKARAL